MDDAELAQPVPVRVFVSYAYDSPEHVEAVRALWVLLRSQGVDARLDRSAEVQRQDWPLWMLEQFRAADFVIVVLAGVPASRGWCGAAG